MPRRTLRSGRSHFISGMVRQRIRGAEHAVTGNQAAGHRRLDAPLLPSRCQLRLQTRCRPTATRACASNLIMFLLVVPLSTWMIKLVPYATFLPVPLIAVWLARPPLKKTKKDRSQYRRDNCRRACSSQLPLRATQSSSCPRPSVDRMEKAMATDARLHRHRRDQPLAKLPKGLAVADVDLGPFIVALTNLDVLAAPYHRLSKSILEADRIMHSPPQEAEQRLRALGASYVITCKGMDSTTPPGACLPMPCRTSFSKASRRRILSRSRSMARRPVKVWRMKP